MRIHGFHPDRRRLPVAVAACLAVVAIGVSGCSEDGTAPPDFDPDACATFAVPTSYGLRWANANHRIALWEVRPDPDADACTAESLRATYIGGDWTTGEAQSDQPSIAAEVALVRAAPERLGVSRRSVRLEVEQPGAASQVITVDRAEAGLRGYPYVNAIVSGVRLETDVPQPEGYPDDYEARFGYTSRGFGAAVEVVAISDTTVDLRVEGRFEHGPSDRENMNRALTVARSAIEIDVLVIGTVEPPVAASAEYAMQYERQLIGEDPEHPHAPDEDAIVAVQGDPEAPSGFVGFASYDLRLSTHGECGPRQECPRGDTCTDGACDEVYGPPGVYVRELSVGASVRSFSAEDGRAELRIDGYASNASLAFAFYALRHDFSAEVLWFQVPTAEPVAIAETFETGVPATFPLP